MVRRLLLTLAFAGCLLPLAPAQGPSKEPKVYEIKGDQKPGEFADVEAWINSKPLTFKQLKGKVVVVHFFAFA